MELLGFGWAWSNDRLFVKVNLIYPASEAHVLKHTDQSFHMAVETKQVYQQITRPFIEAIPKEKIEWVYNILEQYVRQRIVFFYW